MARSLHSLILFPVCAFMAAQAFADPTPAPNPEKKRRQDAQDTTPPPMPSPEFENVRKALDALTPQQRKRFQENFWRWANLSPEEKKALRDREDIRKRLMEQEVQAAMQEAGLQLDGDRRTQFAQRYGEERKKIEEQLRKETQEKRKPLVKDMIGRLKTEFNAPPSPEAAPVAPVAPAKP